MAKMRVAQVSRADGPLEVVERAIPDPGRNSVRIKVQACGVCHSDSLTKGGAFPGLQLPRVPGHEVIGLIDALGPDVAGWSAGQRVGVGWHGGFCGYCLNCRHGDFFACSTMSPVTGLHYDGGYADYMIAHVSALARVPDELSAAEAAPLVCAGVTTFNALRRSAARAGDLVAVHGLGGLGHLGVQFAVKMGFRTVAIARGKDKEGLAHQLGAHHYIDAQATDPASALLAMGGAKVILATVTDGGAMKSVLGGLGVNGTMLVAGATPTLEVSPLQLILGRQAVEGCYSGTAIDSQETLDFSVLAGVRSMNEVFPLDRAAEAFDRMMSGKARFRVVLTTGA